MTETKRRGMIARRIQITAIALGAALTAAHAAQAQRADRVERPNAVRDAERGATRHHPCAEGYAFNPETGECEDLSDYASDGNAPVPYPDITPGGGRGGGRFGRAPLGAPQIFVEGAGVVRHTDMTSHNTEPASDDEETSEETTTQSDADTGVHDGEGCLDRRADC